VEVLKVCEGLLQPSGDDPFKLSTPRVLFEDREQFLFGMTAASQTAQTWKALLMGNDRPDVRVAAGCGQLLAQLHRFWQDEPRATNLDDQQYFFELRVDPYYLEVARRHPRLAQPIDELVAAMDSHRLTLVHGDFSPKNLLVSPHEIMLIDCEVGHYGDPAFDLGFVLTHLLLKAVHFSQASKRYADLAQTLANSYCMFLPLPLLEWNRLQQRTIEHLRACMLARVDGKSPVDCLNDHQCELVRGLALRWFATPPNSIEAACAQTTAWSRGKGELID
jgi:aminoglycoside phosphotransferase (APT) family kinase protein